MKDYEAHGDLYFNPSTPKVLREIIHYAYKSRKRVRIWYGDTETGRDWMEECDVAGTIGRSTGLHAPLLLHSRRSIGGPLLMETCIVKIAVEGIAKWTHPKYKVPSFECKDGQGDVSLRYEVLVDGKVHARFSTQRMRARWIDFMQGKRMGR